YSDFWSYLYKVCKIDECDFTKLGITNEFSKYMCKEKGVYFISNLINLNRELCQFQESDINSICKINVKKILSKDCFIKCIYNNNKYNQSEHILKHEDVSTLEGLGWIEYLDFRCNSFKSQISIEINSIEMQIDYVRTRGAYTRKITPIPNMSLMGYLLPDYHQLFSNVPETFKDKYFSRKEMEILLDLNDILSNL
ncbi:hypothetical protein RhiirA4_515619, partial [Rhizophagus irregularis]